MDEDEPILVHVKLTLPDAYFLLDTLENAYNNLSHLWDNSAKARVNQLRTHILTATDGAHDTWKKRNTIAQVIVQASYPPYMTAVFNAAGHQMPEYQGEWYKKRDAIRANFTGTVEFIGNGGREP